MAKHKYNQWLTNSQNRQIARRKIILAKWSLMDKQLAQEYMAETVS